MHCGAQNWAQCCRCGLTSDEQKRRATSFNLLEMLYLMQPRMLLTFFLSGHIAGLWSICCPPEPPSPSQQSCFKASHPPVCTGAWSNFSLNAGCDICLVKLQEIPLCPLVQPVEVPLDINITTWCTSCSSQFCIICELAEGALCPIVQVINEDVRQYFLQELSPGVHP